MVYFLYLLPLIQRLGLAALIASFIGFIVCVLKKKIATRWLAGLMVVGGISAGVIVIPGFLFDRLVSVDSIARDPNNVPTALSRTEPTHVKLELEAQEIVSEIADGTPLVYWTYNGTVPGPLLRVRVGDTVEFTLKNTSANRKMHNIDLHAVTGPGGGGAVTNVMPGETKTFTFKTLNPGLFVYHCASPNAPIHMAHGMYGLILVEPEGGLPQVDKEFYVMQGEFYSKGIFGRVGHQYFDKEKMRNAQPSYMVFNGATGALKKNMQVRVGEKVRIYFGNGGVNHIASLHLIGEIFDTVYPEASIGGAQFKNVQTTVVPAGGATIVEFTADVPGEYILVDHALARIDKGLSGIITVIGKEQKEIFDGIAGETYSH